MNKKVSLIIIIVLLVGNAFLGYEYFILQKELKEVKEEFKTQQINEKILSFIDLFIVKVLKAQAEISFDDRLELENAVRALKDEEVLLQWQKFIDSTTEEEAQIEVKNLLELLIKKIEVK